MQKLAERDQLFLNGKIYDTNIDVPSDVKNSIEKIPANQLGKDQEKQTEAKKLISNWVKTLWLTMDFVLQTQKFPPDQKEKFKQDFQEKIITFITHPDHGIMHSFFVYKGMLHLSEIDEKPIQIDSKEDKEAQLFALLHDVMQTLPFSINKEGHLANSNQKNEHARIMAVLIRMFGRKIFHNDTLNQETINEFAFGIQTHDSSYSGIYQPDSKLNYIQMLGHDADKIFGASIETDIQTIVRGMIKRNLEANNGPKGSYLLRTELYPEYRSLFEYGHRCWNDCVAVILKEMGIKMYTKSGEKIAEERRHLILEQVHHVYGGFFDSMQSYIIKIIPQLGTPESNLEVIIMGMDQEEMIITHKIKNSYDLKSIINDLYNTPIKLKLREKEIIQLSKIYELEKDARGLKLIIKSKKNSDEKTQIKHLGQNNHKQNGQAQQTDYIPEEFYLDPSVARFCFMKNGRELFLSEITKAFENSLNAKIPELANVSATEK